MIDFVDDGTAPLSQVRVQLGMTLAIFIPAERRTVIGTVSIVVPREIVAGVPSLGSSRWTGRAAKNSTPTAARPGSPRESSSIRARPVACSLSSIRRGEMAKTVSVGLVDRILASLIKSTCASNAGYRLKAYYGVYEETRLGAHVIVQRDADLPYAVYWFTAEVPDFTEGAYFATENQALDEFDHRRIMPRHATTVVA